MALDISNQELTHRNPWFIIPYRPKELQMTITKLWEDFKELPTWKKIFLMFSFVPRRPKIEDELVNFSKGKTDAEVKELAETVSEIKEETTKIDIKKQELKDELNKTHEEYSEFSNRIDSATDGDELVRIAADLRAAAAERKRRLSAGSGNPD
jgi:predicted transcriptional regulator